MDDSRSLENAGIYELSKTVATNSTICESDQMLEKVQHLVKLTNLVFSRMTFVLGKLMEGRYTRRSTQPFMGVSILNKDCKDKLCYLWDSIENIHLKKAGIKTVSYNVIALQLLSRRFQHQLNTQQLSIPNVGDLSENICDVASQYVKILEVEKSLCQEGENKLHSFIDKQNRVVELIEDISHNTKLDDNAHEHNVQKMRKKNKTFKTKIARAIINCLLGSAHIDFEKHPELQEMKKKWRSIHW